MSGSENAQPGRSIRVLLIEDNRMNGYLVSKILTSKGYQVVVEEDGGAGLEAALSNPPDVVLLDLNLPTLDGWNIARRLKSDARTQNVPIIALTTAAMDGDREKALEAGCDEYVTKPVHVPELLDQVGRVTAA